VDRETYPHYQLALLTQRADGSTNVTVVHVILDDVNDNAPVFARTNFSVPVVENLPAGNAVATLKVADLDLGVNADVTLSFASNPLCDVYLSITPAGRVAIKKPLDYEKVPTLTCIVVAKDNGSPSLTSTATLTLLVTDVNEEAVEVAGSGDAVFISLEVPHNAAKGRLVHTLTRHDLGWTLTPPDVTLTFLSTSQDGVFSVDAGTGEVRVQHPELLYANSRYLQWTVAELTQQGSSGVVTSQLTVLRVDAFSMKAHVVALTLDVSSDDLNPERYIIVVRSI
jgi:hypothetical protein